MPAALVRAVHARRKRTGLSQMAEQMTDHVLNGADLEQRIARTKAGLESGQRGLLLRRNDRGAVLRLRGVEL